MANAYNAFVDGLYSTTAKVFLLKNGQVKNLSNENNFHPNANVNGIFVHIEDGVATNIVTINYAPSKRVNWATHDFPLLYIDTIEHTIVGEMTPRTFARYFNYVPSQLLAMNTNQSSIMDVGITVKQQSGANVIGAFTTLSALQSQYNDQVELENFDEINAIAYVYEVGENGYYMVDYVGGTYQWVLKEDGYSTYLSTKPYNMFTIKVQRGYQNTKPITPLEDEQYRLLWAYMGSFAGLIEAIGNRVTTLEEEMDVVQQDISNIENGTTIVEKAKRDQNGNIIDETYATKVELSDVERDLQEQIDDIVDCTTIVKKAEQDKNGNDIVNTYETKADATSKLALKADKTYVDTNKVPKTTTIIGLDLQDNILLGEFKTALGNATQSVAGLLSAEDKTHLDGLVALLENSDGDSVVDTIGEILAIFQDYPEGADLVTVLNGKVDKVVGKQLSTNDLTDILKDRYDTAYAHSQSSGNPHGTKYSELVDKPATFVPTPHEHSAVDITSGTLPLARGGTNRSDGYAVGVVETRANVLTKTWTGTQAQYNAIGTKDNATLYFITD